MSELQVATRRRRALATVPTMADPLYLTEVSVQSLFGRLNYPSLKLKDLSQSSRLSVIYGDNGTGKTTLLKLIYATLCPERNEGHRTFLANTPFLKLSIKFSDNTQISVEKESLSGDYFYVFISESGGCVRLKVTVEHGKRVNAQESVELIIHRLQALGLNILLLDHLRNVKTTFEFLSQASKRPFNRFHDASSREVALTYFEFERGSKDLTSEDLTNIALINIVDITNRWFREQAYSSGQTGDTNASSVYLTIIQQFAKRRGGTRSIEISKVDLSAALRDLDMRMEPFIKTGLLSHHQLKQIGAIYEQANKTNREQIRAVVDPYIQSLELRISSLESIQQHISDLELEINKYFVNKNAKYHVISGLQIFENGSNEPIDFKLLSSGEKQLVFLLCTAVVSRSSRSLILIDEPELSLNYKWQRLIANSLAKLSAGTNTQYILASHSIEIISRYEQSSVNLLPE